MTPRQNNPSYFYYIWGVEVDPASNKLYWTTADPNNNATSIAHNQILSATYSTGATPTLSNIAALYTATTHGPNPTNLSIDVANGVYYVGLGSSAITTGTHRRGQPQHPERHPDDDLHAAHEHAAGRYPVRGARRC